MGRVLAVAFALFLALALGILIAEADHLPYEDVKGWQ
jgi:hypothetical protein